MDKFLNWEVTASSKIKNNGLAWLIQVKIVKKMQSQTESIDAFVEITATTKNSRNLK
jgi:hypothetical protein